MKKLFQKSLISTSISLIFIFAISFLTCIFLREDVEIMNEQTINKDVPNHFLDIFLHNIKFYFIFLIPYLNWIYWGCSFFVISLHIGISFAQKGILFTSLRLLHVPLELYAFVLVLHLSKSIWEARKIDMKQHGVPFLISVFILLMAAVIEINLS